MIATHTCMECHTPIKGRSDKKFCNDYCRNSFHNKQNNAVSIYVKRIIHALRRNRRILETVLPKEEEMYKTTRAKLTEKGFSFTYHTHTYTNKRGNVYFFCFEYGYLPLEADWILVVKRKREG